MVFTSGNPDSRKRGKFHFYDSDKDTFHEVNPSEEKRGLQIIHTKPLTERERESEDFEWSYKHSKEISEEYHKLLEQQHVSEYDTARKAELHELARNIVKEKHGITGF